MLFYVRRNAEWAISVACGSRPSCKYTVPIPHVCCISAGHHAGLQNTIRSANGQTRPGALAASLKAWPREWLLPPRRMLLTLAASLAIPGALAKGSAQAGRRMRRYVSGHNNSVNNTCVIYLFSVTT